MSCRGKRGVQRQEAVGRQGGGVAFVCVLEHRVKEECVFCGCTRQPFGQGASHDHQPTCSRQVGVIVDQSVPPAGQAPCTAPLTTNQVTCGCWSRLLPQTATKRPRTEQRCYKGLNKQLRCNGTPYREATTAGRSKNEPHLEKARNALSVSQKTCKHVRVSEFRSLTSAETGCRCLG
jgi:hypothetical protein